MIVNLANLSTHKTQEIKQEEKKKGALSVEVANYIGISEDEISAVGWVMEGGGARVVLANPLLSAFPLLLSALFVGPRGSRTTLFAEGGDVEFGEGVGFFPVGLLLLSLLSTESGVEVPKMRSRAA